MEAKKKIGLIFASNKSIVMPLFMKALQASSIKDKANFTILSEQDEFEKESELEAAFLDYYLTKEQIKKFLNAHSKLQWVHGPAVGVDHLNIPQIFDNDSLILTNGRGTFDHDLGVLVLGGILHFNMNMPKLRAYKEEKKWERLFPDSTLLKQVGIIGMGSIGSEVARKVKLALDMKVVGLRKRPELTTPEVKQYLDENLGLESLEHVLNTSDFVVNILPKTEETFNFYDQAKFKMMKKDAVFINIGRGHSVDEDALVKALKEKTIGGAFLDVLKHYPHPPESELWNFQNVVMTMHSGGVAKDSFKKIPLLFLKNAEHFIKGEALENVVEKSKGY